MCERKQGERMTREEFVLELQRIGAVKFGSFYPQEWIGIALLL